MSNLTERITSLRVTEEMKERAKEADRPQSKYVRDMWLAGESAIADLDPRVGNSGHHTIDIDSAEAAAKALDDGALLSELSTDERAFEDVVEQLTQQFENVLADRLYEMANDDQSAVDTDGRGNYWLE